MSFMSHIQTFLNEESESHPFRSAVEKLTDTTLAQTELLKCCREALEAINDFKTKFFLPAELEKTLTRLLTVLTSLAEAKIIITKEQYEQLMYSKTSRFDETSHIPFFVECLQQLKLLNQENFNKVVAKNNDKGMFLAFFTQWSSTLTQDHLDILFSCENLEAVMNEWIRSPWILKKEYFWLIMQHPNREYFLKIMPFFRESPSAIWAPSNFESLAHHPSLENLIAVLQESPEIKSQSDFDTALTKANASMLTASQNYHSSTAGSPNFFITVKTATKTSNPTSVANLNSTS